MFSLPRRYTIALKDEYQINTLAQTVRKPIGSNVARKMLIQCAFISILFFRMCSLRLTGDVCKSFKSAGSARNGRNHSGNLTYSGVLLNMMFEKGKTMLYSCRSQWRVSFGKMFW